VKVHKYGDYDEYVREQSTANKLKLHSVWASPTELEIISRHVEQTIPNASFGICHGVRNGWEVQWLRDRLKIDIIGTELAETATNYPHVIQWDFHNTKEEWIGHCDIIYSNAWDHSYDPETCLDKWMSCLKPTGRCFIEWSEEASSKIDRVDCFGASKHECSQLISKKFDIEKVYSVPCTWREVVKRLFKLGKLRVEWRVARRVVFVVKHRNASDKSKS